jgi:hypothetical protein
VGAEMEETHDLKKSSRLGFVAIFDWALDLFIVKNI